MKDYSNTLRTFELLRELFQDRSLTEIAMRIAGATLVDHEIARIKGETVEGPEGLAWGIAKTKQIAEESAKIPEELKAKRDQLAAELEQIATDDQVREQAEELHRKVSRLSAEDLLRPFDI